MANFELIFFSFVNSFDSFLPWRPEKFVFVIKIICQSLGHLISISFWGGEIEFFCLPESIINPPDLKVSTPTPDLRPLPRIFDIFSIERFKLLNLDSKIPVHNETWVPEPSPLWSGMKSETVNLHSLIL